LLSLLWCIPVFFLSGDLDSQEGEEAVSIFFGTLLGAGGLLVGAFLRGVAFRWSHDGG